MAPTTFPRPGQDSDTEDDADYVPPPNDGGSESDSSSSEPQVKRARTASPKRQEEGEEAKQKTRNTLWADFQASVSSMAQRKEDKPPPKLVKIEKRYRFAGEDVIEVVEVPEDSPDAKKWPLSHPSGSPDLVDAGDSQPATRSVVQATCSAPSTTTNPPAPTTAMQPTAKRPGPRKPRISLPSPSTTKAKKLTTLEKSAMDWRAHVSAEGNATLQEELEANRRGGGYLEKVEFLNRVYERKEEALETNKPNKRRRG